MPMVQLALLALMGAFYISAGVMHFVRPRFFLEMMPPALPWPRALVAISGAAEIALGIGVWIPATRVGSAWGIIALLVAVFPANIHAAVARIPGRGGYARLPFQALLIAWAWWYT